MVRLQEGRFQLPFLSQASCVTLGFRARFLTLCRCLKVLVDAQWDFSKALKDFQNGELLKLPTGTFLNLEVPK